VGIPPFFFAPQGFRAESKTQKNWLFVGCIPRGEGYTATVALLGGDFALPRCARTWSLKPDAYPVGRTFLVGEPLRQTHPLCASHLLLVTDLGVPMLIRSWLAVHQLRLVPLELQPARRHGDCDQHPFPLNHGGDFHAVTAISRRSASPKGVPFAAGVLVRTQRAQPTSANAAHCTRRSFLFSSGSTHVD
jgi:hypothetical protein